MKLVLEGASASAGPVWLLQLQRRELELLGRPKHQGGGPNVLMVSQALFDPQTGRLEFDVSDVVVINLGNSSDTIVVDNGFHLPSGGNNAPGEVPGPSEKPKAQLGSGDRALMAMVRAEAPQLEELAEKLLSRVRLLFPGDLKECERRLFVEERDNFWAIQLQPRVGNFLIIVKGNPSRFMPSKLPLKAARSRYTRFYVEKVSEIEAAIDLIKNAIKKDLD